MPSISFLVDELSEHDGQRLLDIQRKGIGEKLIAGKDILVQQHGGRDRNFYRVQRVRFFRIDQILSK